MRDEKRERRKEGKKRAGRVYEPCIIELHSRCMAAGLMQGSLFPRWPIHSPRDLGACMPRTYQRLLHDRSCYVSKCRVCIVFPFFPSSSSTVRMHVHTLQLLTSIYSHASNRAWYRLPRTLHFNLLKCWLLYPRFLSVRVTSRVRQKFKE